MAKPTASSVPSPTTPPAIGSRHSAAMLSNQYGWSQNHPAARSKAPAQHHARRTRKDCRNKRRPTRVSWLRNGEEVDIKCLASSGSRRNYRMHFLEFKRPGKPLIVYGEFGVGSNKNYQSQANCLQGGWAMRYLVLTVVLAVPGEFRAAELESRVLTHYLPQDFLETAIRTEGWTEIPLKVNGGLRKGDVIRIWAGGSIDRGNGDQPGQN